MEFQFVVTASPDDQPFQLWIEPEGMAYAFSAAGKVVLAFRGPDAMTAEISHRADAVIVWRPADTEVWATTPDGVGGQIAGWRDNPAPGLDSGGPTLDVPARELIESIFHPNQSVEPPAGSATGQNE